MHEEIIYLRMREKKVMYLVYLLQSQGYPVNETFESKVKPIPTANFQDFLDKHPEVED